MVIWNLLEGKGWRFHLFPFMKLRKYLYLQSYLYLILCLYLSVSNVLEIICLSVLYTVYLGVTD